MMRPAIELISEIFVPESVSAHPNVTQICNSLRARVDLDDDDRVIGTQNTQKPELYGWIGNIDWHVDNKGDVYFLILSDSTGVLFAEGETPISYSQGDVIRMNDFTRHRVEQNGLAVGLFMGAFEYGDDTKAINALTEAVSALTEQYKSNYDNAPRWEGSPLQDDECYIWHFDEECNYERTLLERATDTQGMILTCSHDGCTKPASEIDHHFPYMSDQNRCTTHQRGLR